jgi:hypothetical protein
VEKTLGKIVEQGLDRKVLEASINHFEFKLREANYGRYPKGLMYGLQSFDSWLYDDDAPFSYLSYIDAFAFLKEQIDTDYFTNLLKKYVLDNTHKAIVTAVPKKGLNRENDKKVAEKLAQYKASLSKEELEALVVQTKELADYQSEPSPEKDLLTIPLLELSDIGKEAYHIKNKEQRIEEVTMVSHDIFTNGIAYVSYYFSLNHVPVKLLPYVSLLTALYKEVDTDKRDYSSLANEIDLKTGGIGFSLSSVGVPKEMGEYKASFSVKTKVLYENLPDALSLMEEIMFTSHVTDKKRLKEVLGEMYSQMKESIQESGHTATANRAMSYFSKGAYVKELMEGIDFYEFVGEIYKNFDAMYSQICDNLKAALHAVAKKENLIISYTGKEDISRELQNAITSLQEYMNEDAYDVEEQHFDLKEKNEGFQTSSKVQYVAAAGNYAQAGLSYTGALRVLQVIFSYDYLWINVRVKGGAYGCMCNFSQTGDAYFTSYRDPNLSKTYQVYEKAAEYVRSFDVSNRDMVKYIIGAIAKLDAPMTPSADGAYSFLMYQVGITQEKLQKEREEVLGCNIQAIRNLAPYIEAILSKGCRCALGDEEVIAKEQDLFAVTKPLV